MKKRSAASILRGRRSVANGRVTPYTGAGPEWCMVKFTSPEDLEKALRMLIRRLPPGIEMAYLPVPKIQTDPIHQAGYLGIRVTEK